MHSLFLTAFLDFILQWTSILFVVRYFYKGKISTILI